MNKQNRIVVACIFCMLALIFIIFPVGASNLHLKITFGTESKDKTVPDDFYLYYSIDGSDFSEENMVKGSLDEKKNEITFTLDSSYESKITLLRLDFPSQNDILKVESVSVSSGGLNKKIYTADEFFDKKNVPFDNEIGSITPVSTRGIAYIETKESDPYVILSEAISTSIGRSFSHYYISRIVLVLLVVVSIVSYKVNVFGVKHEE